MTKREEREHLFKLLFCKDFHDVAELKEQVELYQKQQEIFNEEEFAPIKKKLEAIVKTQKEEIRGGSHQFRTSGDEGGGG